MFKRRGQGRLPCRDAVVFCLLQLMAWKVCSVEAPLMAEKLTSSPPSQALEKLRDIHAPAPVGWWPLAPGWYLLLVMLILAVCGILFFVLRRVANSRAKRQALQLLLSYEQQYQQVPNSQLTTAHVSELLRRVALVYFPREAVAGLQGEAWIMFLNNTSKGLDFSKVYHELLEMPYQPKTSGDLQALFRLARTWISQRRGPCLN